LKKGQDPYLGLMAYKSSPLENSVSPAELLMGGKLRTTMPSLPLVLAPKQPDVQRVKQKEAHTRAHSKDKFDLRH